MPFSSTASLINTDMDNTLRGVYRDNADHAVTGTTSETDLASTTITGGTIGATGCLHVYAAGTITNAVNNTKTVRLYLGSTAIATVSRTAANAQDWLMYAVISNTAAATQRIGVLFSTADAVTVSFDYITAAIDTASNQTLEVTGQLTAAGDNTITQTKFEVFVSQIS